MLVFFSFFIQLILKSVLCCNILFRSTLAGPNILIYFLSCCWAVVIMSLRISEMEEQVATPSVSASIPGLRARHQRFARNRRRDLESRHHDKADDSSKKSSKDDGSSSDDDKVKVKTVTEVLSVTKSAVVTLGPSVQTVYVQKTLSPSTSTVISTPAPAVITVVSYQTLPASTVTKVQTTMLYSTIIMPPTTVQATIQAVSTIEAISTILATSLLQTTSKATTSKATTSETSTIAVVSSC